MGERVLPMLRVIGLAAALVTAGGAGVRAQTGSQPGARSVWDGVFTAEQADRGAAGYVARCAACHGVTLGGTGEAPGLSGGEFVSHYDQLSMGDLFDRVRSTMPQNAPQSLGREEYADIVAYLLQANGFPAGAAPLDKRSEVLAMIAIQAQRPAGAAAPASR